MKLMVPRIAIEVLSLRHCLTLGLFLIAFLPACHQRGAGVQFDTDAGGDVDSDTDVDTDSGTDSDSDGDTDTGTGPEIPTIVIPDTNQKQCTSDNPFWQWVDCEEIAEGDSLFGQDGHYRSEPRQHDYEDLGDGTVRDNVTGLEWQQCVGGLEGEFCTEGTAWPGPWEVAADFCDELGVGSQHDWRLGTIHEIAWLLDLEGDVVAIDTIVFPGPPWGGVVFWSNTDSGCECLSAAGCISAFGFAAGGSGPDLYAVDSEWEDGRTRCARGEEVSLGLLSDAAIDGERVVEDLGTTLIWQGCTGGQSGDICESGEVALFSWADALQYCEDLEWAGCDDWRLPDRNEILSIVDPNECEPALFSDFVCAVAEDTAWWTSSTVAAEVDKASVLEGFTASYAALSKDGVGNVICVRGGP